MGSARVRASRGAARGSLVPRTVSALHAWQVPGQGNNLGFDPYDRIVSLGVSGWTDMSRQVTPDVPAKPPADMQPKSRGSERRLGRQVLRRYWRLGKSFASLHGIGPPPP